MFGLFVAAAGRYVWYLYTEKLLDGGEALAAFLAVAAYAAQIISRWGTIWGPLLLIVAVVGAPLAFWAHRTTVQHGIERMMREDGLAWERTAHKDPRNAAAHHFLGELYLEAGAYEAALRAFEQAVELSPQDRSHRAGLEKARRRHGEREHRTTHCPRCGDPLETGARICPSCIRRAVEREEAGAGPEPLPRWVSFALAGTLVVAGAGSVSGVLPGWLGAGVSIAALAAAGVYVHRRARR